MDSIRTSAIQEKVDLGFECTYMHAELQEFIHAVEAAIPGCKVSCFEPREAWVYMPNDLFAMGKIGYGQYKGGKQAETYFYMVQSPNIQNNRYASYSEGFHQKHTADRTKALENAKRYLRSYTMSNLAEEYRPAFAQAVSKVRNEHWNDKHEAMRLLFETSMSVPLNTPMMDELFNLLDTGYAFLHKTVYDRLVKLRDAHRALEAHAVPDRAQFVYMHTCPTTPYVAVLPVSRPAAYDPFYHPSKKYEPDVVPEEIRGAVAVLSMLDDETYVKGVGMKVNDRVFYVTQ